MHVLHIGIPIVFLEAVFFYGLLLGKIFLSHPADTTDMPKYYGYQSDKGGYIQTTLGDEYQTLQVAPSAQDLLEDLGYNPSDREEAVLEHMKKGRDSDEPWGYTSASVAGEALDMPRQYPSSALSSLHAAGGLRKSSRKVQDWIGLSPIQENDPRHS